MRILVDSLAATDYDARHALFNAALEFSASLHESPFPSLTPPPSNFWVPGKNNLNNPKPVHMTCGETQRFGCAYLVFFFLSFLLAGALLLHLP